MKELAALKIDGCMHPLPQIGGCSCTRRTRSNTDPVKVKLPDGNLFPSTERGVTCKVRLLDKYN